MNLGDCFSDEFKSQYAKDKLDLGTTLIVEIPNFNLDYKKYAIIVGVESDEVALVVINSEINPNVFKSNYLVSQHVDIPLLGHENFLIKDSHIDCTKFQYKSKTEVIDYIENNPHIVFNVADDVCKKINSTITYSRLISLQEKKRFGFA